VNTYMNTDSHITELRRLLLYRRSLCKSLLFCHSDDDNDDVEEGSKINFENDD